MGPGGEGDKVASQLDIGWFILQRISRMPVWEPVKRLSETLSLRTRSPLLRRDGVGTVLFTRRIAESILRAPVKKTGSRHGWGSLLDDLVAMASSLCAGHLTKGLTCAFIPQRY